MDSPQLGEGLLGGADSAKPDAKKDIWDKLNIVGRLVVLIAAAVIFGIWGRQIQAKSQDHERRLKYVELAVSVLRSTPDEKLLGLRHWAIEVLDSNSSVKLTEATKRELLEKPAPLDNNTPGGTPIRLRLDNTPEGIPVLQQLDNSPEGKPIDTNAPPEKPK